MRNATGFSYRRLRAVALMRRMIADLRSGRANHESGLYEMPAGRGQRGDRGLAWHRDAWP